MLRSLKLKAPFSPASLVLVTACGLLLILTGCKNSSPHLSDSFLKTAEEGDTFLLGKYEQDNNLENGKEDIEWTVLERDGDSLTVITKYAIESMPFHDTESFEETDWASSTIRQWLNGDFYEDAFSESEKTYIQYSAISNPDHPILGTSGGESTQDHVFLLDTDTIEYLYSDYVIGIYEITNEGNSVKMTVSQPLKYEPLCAKFTEYAKQRYIPGMASYLDYETDFEEEYGENACYWWLRNAGDQEYSILFVTPEGGTMSCPASADAGIRPVMVLAAPRS